MGGNELKNKTSMAMASVLIISSVALALYLGVVDHNITSGVRWYIAQAFLLAGSLFGLDYYVKKILGQK